MNLVLLCKRHNHRKVLDILAAFRNEGLSVGGIVAAAPSPPPASVRTIARELHPLKLQRRLRVTVARVRRSTHQRADMSPNPPSTAQEGRPAAGNANNGRLPQVENESVLSGCQTIDDYVQQFHTPLREVHDLNSAEAEDAIRTLQPDLLILGGAPIIRSHILALPQHGTINVHQGELPAMRGMNVAEWSVFRGRSVIVTVHLVDQGVDTGAILHRETLDVSHCRTIAEMRRMLSPLQHRVLARVTKSYSQGEITPIQQSSPDGLQYYVMHDKLRRVVEHKLTRGFKPESLNHPHSHPVPSL